MSIFGIVSSAFAYGSYGVSSGVSTIAMSGGAGSGTAAMPLYIASVEAPITGSTTAFISSLDQCSTWSSLNQDWVRYNNTTLEAWNVMPTSCAQGAYQTKSATVFIKGASVVSFNVSMPMFIGNSGDGVISSAATAFMYAPAFEVASGTAFMSGHDYVTKAVDVFISGENYSSQSSGTLFISGNAESTLDGSLYIFGME